MASGLVYRRFPKPTPIKFYGFERVDKEAEAQIVERLMRPTTAFRIASEDVWTSEKPRHFTGDGVRYPRAKTRCPKYCESDEVFEKPVVRPASSGIASSFSDKELLDRSTLSKDKYEAYRIDKIFRRLQRSHTQSSRLRMNIPQSTDEYEEKKNRPKSGASSSCLEPPENVICLDSTDSRDIVQLIHDLEDRRNEHLRLTRLRRPTTASSKKYLGHCVYCNETEELSEWWLQRNSTTLTNKEKCDAVREQRKLLRRIRQPTMASQQLSGQTDHLKVCRKHAQLFKDEIRDKNLPLISGLPKSKNLDEITNRLMMKYRYDDYD